MTQDNEFKNDLDEVLKNSRKSILKNIATVSLLIIAMIILYVSNYFQTQDTQILQYLLPISTFVGTFYIVWESFKYFKAKREFVKFLGNTDHTKSNKILSDIKNKKYKRFNLIGDYNKRTENFVLYFFPSHLLLIKKDPPKIEVFNVSEIEKLKIDIFPNRLSRYNPSTWWIDITFNDNTNKLLHFVFTKDNYQIVQLLKQKAPQFEVGKIEVDENEKEKVLDVVGKRKN